MIDRIRRLRSNVRRFHEDEHGVAQLTYVMILALAGLAMLLLYNFFDQIKEHAQGILDRILGRTEP